MRDMTMRIYDVLLFSCLVLLHSHPVMGTEPLIPGSGHPIAKVGDDFEDPNWSYNFQGAKSSKNLDEQMRAPAGESQNKRWYEGIKRGHPDVIQRVETPPGGLTGSTGALLLRSMRTGIPGRYSNRMQQDDLIADVHYRLGGSIPVHQSPSVVARVFLPPIDSWENRTGPHFGFRTSCERIHGRERETYWPGMFIVLESKDDFEDREHDYAYLRVRGDRRGLDFRGTQITQTGWWTFGMSFTPDGQVHYYASPGVDELTAEDHIRSEFPYSYRCHGLKTFFFNVCSLDNGHTWSTTWVVDDPTVYFVPTGTASHNAPTRR